MYIGEKIYYKKHISILYVFLPIILHSLQFVFFRLFSNPFMEVLHSPFRDLTYTLLAGSVTYFFAFLFSKVSENTNKWRLKKLWGNIGSISLESYLFNTYIGYVLQYLILSNILHKGITLFCVYLLSCIIGLLISKPYQKFIKYFYAQSIQTNH